MIARLIILARRCAVVLSGEMLQSAFHFAINILLVRTLPAADYGVFAIVLLMGGLALTYMRAFAGLPANLFIPQHAGTRRTLPFEVTFGSVAVLFAAACGLTVMLTLELWLQAHAFMGGLFVGFWALRSYLRSVIFAKQRQGLATISDLIFTLSGGILTLGLYVATAGNLSLELVFGVLALANVLAVVSALLLQRQKVRLTYRARSMRRYRALLSQLLWSAAGTTTANIQAQGQVLLIAAFSGPAAYAPIAAMLTMFAPLRLVMLALANMVQPEIAALSHRRDNTAILRLTRNWTAMMGVIGLFYALAMIFAVPVLGSAVFNGQPRILIGILACGISATPLFYVMPKVLLEVRRSFQAMAVISSVGACVGMTLVVALLVTQSPAWSLVGSFTSEVVVLVCCWIAVLRPGAFAMATPAAAGISSHGHDVQANGA